MCHSLKNNLFSMVGGHRCTPHCIVGRPINSWQQQQLCPPPPQRIMFPHEPSIRPNTLQWCPTAVWGALTIKHLSVCPSVWWFWFSNLLSADFSSGTPWSSAPTTIIQVRQFREITGASNCEITCVYRIYSRCSLGLPESVIPEYTDFSPTRARGVCPTAGSFKGLNTDSIETREKKGFS